MTCSALISSCITVVWGDEVMAAQKMLEMLITPFTVDKNALNHPPSDFEFVAAKIACTHLEGWNPFSEHWWAIVRAQNLEAISAEDNFWAVCLANYINIDHVLFGQFHRINVKGWTFELEGSSSSDHNDEPEEDEILDDGPGEDENIPSPNAHAPPGSPPTYLPQSPKPNLFGLGGTSNEPPVGFDEYGLPIAKPQATIDEEIFCCRWAVIDHFSMAQCTGFAGSCFNEVPHFWSSVQVSWAGAFSDAPFSAIIDTLWEPHPNKRRGSLELEQKMEVPPPNSAPLETTIHPWCERT